MVRSGLGSTMFRGLGGLSEEFRVPVVAFLKCGRLFRDCEWETVDCSEMVLSIMFDESKVDENQRRKRGCKKLIS